MTKRTLLVMAAGDETVMDYSVYDGMNAGFDRLQYVIHRDIEQTVQKSMRLDEYPERLWL